MRVLEIIPIPFFTARGTGFSSFNRTKVMSELGHAVDIITLPYGEDIELRNVNLYRVLKIPLFKNIKMGPSLGKYLYNILLFIQAFMMMIRGRYDCLHLHGESVYYGLILKFLFDVKILHDFHNSIPVDYKNYRPAANPLFIKVLSIMERFALKHSDIIIVICPELKKMITNVSADKVFIVENYSLKPKAGIKKGDTIKIRNTLGLEDGEKLVTYAGSFGTNQSLEIFISSIPTIIEKMDHVKFLMVGGDDKEAERLKKIIVNLGIEDFVSFEGKKSLYEIWVYMDASDLLVSSMVRGRNTPSKIYSYLDTGKPIVVTDSIPHTQVVDNTMAMIVEPDPESFAHAIIHILSNEEFANKLTCKAMEQVEKKYSYRNFFENTRMALNAIE